MIIGIIIAVVILGLAVASIGAHKGWFKDEDDNGMADFVDDAVEDVKDKVKEVKGKVVKKRAPKKKAAPKKTAPKTSGTKTRSGSSSSSGGGSSHYNGTRG